MLLHFPYYLGPFWRKRFGTYMEMQSEENYQVVKQMKIAQNEVLPNAKSIDYQPR